jgi:hypothetical protein
MEGKHVRRMASYLIANSGLGDGPKPSAAQNYITILRSKPGPLRRVEPTRPAHGFFVDSALQTR